MLITSKIHTADSLRDAVERVGEVEYSGNLTCEVSHVRGNQYRVKIGTLNSYASGSRTSWSGRHGRWACWHAFRDALLAIYTVDCDARVQTSLTTYRSAADFLASYRETAYTNIGSMMNPAYMPDLCVKH